MTQREIIIIEKKTRNIVITLITSLQLKSTQTTEEMMIKDNMFV